MLRRPRRSDRRPRFSSPYVILQALALILCFAGACVEAAEEAGSEDCADCHALDDGAGTSATEGQDQDRLSFEDSVHGFLDCTDCHEGATQVPHAGMGKPACGDCHEEVSEAYDGSVHGRAVVHGEGGAADCAGCHGSVHSLRPIADPASPVHPSRLAETCGGCHSDPELVSRFGIDIVNPLQAYRRSVHVAARDGKGATCNSCHGSHDIRASSDPTSPIYHDNVPETCGHCHGEIAEAFSKSIHGTALARGVRDVPVCTDCHGEHQILAPSDAGSPVSPTNQSLLTCGHCHGDVRLSEKYGLPTDKVPSYGSSYHGLAVKAGGTTAASCASCHGVHDILPSSDPGSRIHPDNLAATCSECHPGTTGTRFAIGPVHVVESDANFPVVYWIRLIYIIIIVGAVGFMLLHVTLDFIRKFGEPELRALSAAPASGAERMMPGFRIAHALVMISFPVLVYSGFALTYPDTWWAWPLTKMGPDFRGMVHRIAAVVIIVALILHVLHLIVSPRARACIRLMVPAWADLRELIQRFSYYVGLRKEPVHSPQVGYIEKIEYLAFWWGMFVMTITGLLLWYEDFMLHELPSWAPAAMTAIHFYEAVLATLSILIWHMYWTVFDPAVYPMDLSWLTGKAPASREWERGESGAPEAGEGKRRSGEEHS